jgi:hypothetical protein
MNNKKDIRVATILFVIQLLLIMVLVYTDIPDSLSINPTSLFLILFAALPITYLVFGARALRKRGEKIIPSLLVLMSAVSLAILLFMMLWGA